jgi:hypothetical protein
MKAIVAAFAVALVAGPAFAEVVVVRDAPSVANCKALGEVRASSLMGGLLATAAYDKVIRQMKERAAKLGGTHVLLLDSASGYSGARMFGTAYACPIAPA